MGSGGDPDSALGAADALAQHKAPNQQPTTAEAPKAPTGEIALGSAVPRAVTADGKAAAGRELHRRVTAEVAKPEAVGQTEELQRWVGVPAEGRGQGTRSRQHRPGRGSQGGREGRSPGGGGSKVQMLRGNEYLRVWFNRGGNHYLINLATGATATK